MKKISNYLKILMVLVMVVSLIQISPTKAAEDITVGASERIVISFTWSNTLEAPPTINKEMFDVSTTDWIYVYDNTDMCMMGVIDEKFEGISLNSEYDRFICSPKEGSATFYGSGLIEEISVEHDTTKPAAQYCDLRYFDKYKIENNDQYDLFLSPVGDYLVDYTPISSDGIPMDPVTGEYLPERVYSGETIELTATSDGTYDINNPSVGGFYYYSEASNYTVTRTMADAYAELNKNEYDLNGITYTITNNAGYEIDIMSNSTVEFEATIYNASGVATGNVNNAQSIGQEVSSTIPAKGKIVYNSVEEPDSILNISNYSIFDDFISVSGIRKAAPPENKKIYIHFPSGALVPSGLLQDDKGYYISTEVTYVDTDYTEEADTIGGFTIQSIKDSTGMATVNKWYVYAEEIDSYFETSEVAGDKLVVEPFESDFYTQLLRSYGDSSEYHLYAQWEIQTITQSGTYNLIQDVEYRLGSGTWTIGDDACVYNGDMAFYLDGSAGSYEITLK